MQFLERIYNIYIFGSRINTATETVAIQWFQLYVYIKNF